MKKKVLVLGGNFGGLTAALAVQHELDGDADVTVISASDEFLFNPSLIWVPFGKRARKDITFELEPTFTDHGVEFVHAPATAIDPDAKTVADAGGVLLYPGGYTGIKSATLEGAAAPTQEAPHDARQAHSG